MTQDNSEEQNSPYPQPGTSPVLLTFPYIFTQDDLLTRGDFLKRAKDRGQSLHLDDLQKLHEHQLLVPLYRIGDEPNEAQRIDVVANGGMNARGWVLEAAAAGKLRDPADEGYSSEWPYALPPKERPDRWWNG